jgi:hypothetical protein
MAPPTAVLSLLSPRTALHLLIRCYNQLPAYLLRTTSDLSTISDLAKTFDNSMSEAVAAVLQLDPSDEFTTRLYLPRKFCVLGFSRHDGSTRFCPSWLSWTSLLPTTHPKISSPITYPTGNTGSSTGPHRPHRRNHALPCQPNSKEHFGHREDPRLQVAEHRPPLPPSGLSRNPAICLVDVEFHRQLNQLHSLSHRTRLRRLLS